MKQEIKDIMQRLLKRHKELGIDEMVDKTAIQQEMVDKWSIKPTLAGKLADIVVFMDDKEEIRTEQIVTQLGLTETTAKRYLRQLTEFGYLEAHGGNRNKSYTKKKVKE